ncbi:MAG TPA: glycoside hydrolase family 15 protein [Verrucomicrobiae bacterium]|nr:glycoside hydrolase family 15 protein [Verrucomicrobiae bacterium]
MPRAHLDYDSIIAHHLKVLEKLQAPSGLFRASASSVTTGYDKAWLRDNFYECLAFEYVGRWDIVRKTYRAILDIFLKHEAQIDKAIKKKPTIAHAYIHPRYHPTTFEQFWEDWGNKQNDAVGAILFRIGELEQHPEFSLIENANDKRIVQKLVNYLESLEYWMDTDNGMWEENEEVHASSVGACVAGLKKIQELGFIKVKPQLITRGEEVLRKMLPRESEQKFTDLALLSLIYPYNIVTATERDEILRNMEYHLVKDMGVLRYKNDMYYNSDKVDGRSQEAEWTFGFSWLAIIYEQMGDQEKAKHYLQRAMATVNKGGDIPELYFSHSHEHNENSPLGWSESMFIVATHLFNEKYVKPFGK